MPVPSFICRGINRSLNGSLTAVSQLGSIRHGRVPGGVITAIRMCVQTSNLILLNRFNTHDHRRQNLRVTNLRTFGHKPTTLVSKQQIWSLRQCDPFKRHLCLYPAGVFSQAVWFLPPRSALIGWEHSHNVRVGMKEPTGQPEDTV